MGFIRRKIRSIDDSEIGQFKNPTANLKANVKYSTPFKMGHCIKCEKNDFLYPITYTLCPNCFHHTVIGLSRSQAQYKSTPVYFCEVCHQCGKQQFYQGFSVTLRSCRPCIYTASSRIRQARKVF